MLETVGDVHTHTHTGVFRNKNQNLYSLFIKAYGKLAVYLFVLQKNIYKYSYKILINNCFY